MAMSEEYVSLQSALRALRYALGSVRFRDTERRVIFFEFVVALNRYGEIDSDKASEILQRADPFLEELIQA